MMIAFSFRKSECSKTNALLLACQLPEEDLHRSHSLMSHLGPEFSIKGSTAEGTVLKPANEMDIQVTFKALKGRSLTLGEGGANAMMLTVPNNCTPLRPFVVNGTLDYPNFFNFFLKEIRRSLFNVKDSLPRELTFTKDWKPCQTCLVRAKSAGNPLSHCQSCPLPPVVHTKVGACLMFKYKTTVLTVDLVPVFSLEDGGGWVDLFEKTFWTLYRQRPPGWEDYCKGVASMNSFLPESSSQAESAHHSFKHEVAVKFVNNSKFEPNHVIRPGQSLDAGCFSREDFLREVYTCLKALKRLVRVDLSSYLVKKIVLSEAAFVRSVSRANLSYSLCKIVSETSLADHFRHHLDLVEWNRRIFLQKLDDIPLRKK